MAFTDRNPKTILHSWGRFRAMVYEAVVVGDLLAVKEHATTGCFQLADDSNGYAAVAIACQDGAALDTIWMCLAAELKAPATVGTGGVVTQQYFIGAAEVLGDELFLGESGKVEHTIGGTTKQHVGYALSRDRIIVVPGHVLGSVAGSFTTLAASGAVSLSDTLAVTGATTCAAITASGVLIHNATLIAPGFKTGATTSIADSLAIPVTHAVVAKTTGADAEALTLANGTAGQKLMIYLATDGGGDGTLTPATCSGFATIVFADAGDQAQLLYVDDTVGWIIEGLAGVAAPPVITV